jgi:hypothetical protein
MVARMRARVVTRLIGLSAVAFLASGPAFAQDPPPPIGPFAVDIRGSFPGAPDDAALAASRGMAEDELPGRGPGLEIGAHFYPLRWKAMTIGLGGQIFLVRASSGGIPSAGIRGAQSKITSLSPQLSFNFGTGHGWSYITGGIGPTTWSLVPDGSAPLAIDDTRLQTVNYGGGARWFVRTHVAFTVDLRFYDTAAGVPEAGFPAHPRTRLVVISAGISFK